MLLSKYVHLGQLPMDERRPFDILFIDQVHELKEKHSSLVRAESVITFGSPFPSAALLPLLENDRNDQCSCQRERER